MIREAARRLVIAPPPVAPFRVKAPVELTMDFNPGPYLDGLRKRAGNLMSSPTRLTFSNGASVTELWARYWALKLEIQKDLLYASSTK
jgi:hypothetical protein